MRKAIIDLDRDIEDLVEEWLWLRGALSIASEPPHQTKRHLTALFQDVTPHRFRADLARFLEPRVARAVRFERVDPKEWQVQWRENFKPIQVGPFRLIGEWEAEPESPETIRIYPGQAFGTGQHETTRMMIEQLAKLNLEGKRVLDVGCGTGILAIAAERLGAGSVFGFDADPDCEENMQRHLRSNETKHVSLAIGRLEDFQLDPFDIILANITINVLTEVWPDLARLLVPGGVMLNSGILEEQRESATHHLLKAGLMPRTERIMGEWVLIEAHHS